MKTVLPTSRAGNDGLLSLFCGAGGLDLGFEQAGFEVAAAFDVRSDAVASYNHNRKRSARVARTGDVREITSESLDFILGRRFEPRGVIGGPPCQSFSRATHSAEDDPRHELPIKYAELLRRLNARKPIEFFVLENVPGLLKQKHADRLRSFLEAFDDAGFNVSQALLNARDFGVPQNRPRLIIVGINRKLFGKRQWLPPISRQRREKTVRETIGSLPEATFWTRELERNEISHHPNHWCMTPKSVSFSTPGRLIPGTARGRSFRTLEWDEVSPTVAYGNREVHVHPNCHRRLSVHEALLLQGFPRRFELLGSLSSQITQVSEAVPPPMGKVIAASVINFLSDGTEDPEIDEVA
ncbi:DNA (cytosine-5)-methyltransferase 1 [Paracoccus pantotrophus]|nr:DNA (cytosine-5)-methyltransferase 1 [Paracoccus pantotrophus]